MPSYNAESVVRALAEFRPERLALASVPEGGLELPGWQDRTDLPVPLAIVPWARRRGIQLDAIGELHPIPRRSRTCAAT